MSFLPSTIECPVSKLAGVAVFVLLVVSLAVTPVAAQPVDFVLKWGSLGSAEGQFWDEQGVALDGSGNVYVADEVNDRIQKFDSSGNFLLMFGWGVDTGAAALETCAGGCQAGIQGSGDGQFNDPWGVTVDASGNVYVVDENNDRIQKFDSSRNFLTQWGTTGSGDELGALSARSS